MRQTQNFEKLSKRRRQENERIFRDTNRSIHDATGRIMTAAEQGQVPLSFYCECSDMHCLERIKLTADEYRRTHQNENCFVVIAGHESPDIEDVIAKTDGHLVVKKFEIK
jgi:hypothetical protein